MYWIKVNKEEKCPEFLETFLIMDEYGCINLGHNCFDYYDSEYWSPLPKLPLSDAFITNDDGIKILLSN